MNWKKLIKRVGLVIATLLLSLLVINIWPSVQLWIAVHQTPLLVILTALTFASFGLVNGAFYARGRSTRFIDVHLASEINGAIAYIFSVVASLHPIPAFGAVLIGMFGFQCFVNKGSGLSCVNPDEDPKYEVGGSPILQFKRWAVGYYRYIKLALGMILVTTFYLWPTPYTYLAKIANRTSLELLHLMKSLF